MLVETVGKGVPIVAQWITNPTSISEDVGSVLGLKEGGGIRLYFE